MSDKKHMKIYDYTKGTGNEIEPKDLPEGTTYKWIDTLGGGSLKGPAKKGTDRPDGKRGHGGVLSYDSKGDPVVVYHG
jgi:hypothetical protein